ncbi:hypothetical protein JX266_000036 [Neoarthrinium moseri]|nr:hypothetical protein JX266_000036 [Neoarthrinium moseri]
MAAEIENRGPPLFAIDVFFMTLAIITSLLRFYTRIFMVKAFGIDDWFMLIATIAFTLFASFSIAGVHYGTGRHFADLELHNAITAMNCWFFCYLFYAMSMIASKLSIGCFLLRITVKKIHIWIVYAAMSFSVLAGFAFFLVTLLQCQPVSYFWYRVDPTAPGTCVSADVIIALAALYSAFSVISDFTFAILPAFLLWDLQMNRRTKFTIIPILAMGCIASSAVVARFPYLHQLRDTDFLFATVDIAIWSCVEQGLAITAGCCATLRPLLKDIGTRLGWTRPSGVSGATSGIGQHSSAMAISGRSRNRELYDLSDFSQIDDDPEANRAGGDGGGKAKRDVRFSVTGFGKGGRDSMKLKTVCEKDESQEELRDQTSKEIVVSKDFLVSSEWK